MLDHGLLDPRRGRLISGAGDVLRLVDLPDTERWRLPCSDLGLGTPLLLPQMPRQEIIAASLANRGALIKVGSMDEACDIANFIAPEHLDEVVTPFFTTKEQGTGLGLKILAVFADQMRGQLFVQGSPDQGAEVRLRFQLVVTEA